MFNGYNETPLISYNEFNQDRIEKKQENVPKWSYGHDAGVQSAQNHPNNRHSEFWSGKSNFLGLPNVVKCSCTGCYPSSENQSYQGDTSRHRPWLPRTFPVLLNSSSESCKLPAYQWDNGVSSQSSCYSENNFPFMQENGGKYPYYRHYQNSRLPEPNQPGVITSVKDVDYVKKPKNEMSSRTLESSIQNGTRQPVFCNPAYNLTKRTDGRNYCDPNDKYSNLASYSIDQHIPRLPVEPFIKAVPSNLSQNRVPSTGYRSVKENISQPYIDSGFGDSRKICTEPVINSDKRNEVFLTGQIQSGTHTDHSHLKRDLHEEEPQKLFFDNSRHSDYFSRSGIQNAMKRNSQIVDNRKDYSVNQISQMSMSEQHYNMPRSKYQEVENPKSSYEAFYPEEFEKIKPENHLLENSACFQRMEDTKSENADIHARLSRSALLFNGPRFDNTQNSFSYQSDPISYRNHLRPEYSYQNFNSQVRFEHSEGFQRNDFNQYRATSQQIQNGEQFSAQQNSGLVYNLQYQQNSDKTQQFCGEKNPSSFQADFQAVENKKINYLEAVRSEEIKKNGTSKISPLRLLRKKKFINVPHESTPASTLESAPGLDVRKFWSTWAEEEEENLAPSQMVVLDCQNIDPEQAKLLNLYETDPVRAVHFESGNIVTKGSNCTKDSTSQAVQFEQIKTYEELMSSEPKTDERKNLENEKSAMQQKEAEEVEDNNSVIVPETESKSAIVESTCPMKSPSKLYKKVRPEQENRGKKKSETMDKWTEKKFDFLKRAEESKAAEILRHEEEKKKIFETRQSIQQSLKRTEKQEKSIGGDENVPEISSFDDSLQSDSPQNGSSDTINLPTSEYRRNKFLDYSDRKIMLNGKDKVEKNLTVEANSYACNEPNEEIKKEENVKLECSDKRPGKHSTETLFPSLNTKFKEEANVEIDEILKKISDINFQSSEIKIEDEIENGIAKKSKPLVKKPKKKKSDHQTENDERKDKVTVETVSKPTIKFSIQKSHDLKISFKVLNSNKEYSDVDVRSEDMETKGNAIDDSKNSTELITLKYKSIQRDGDRRQNSDFIRNRRGFRRKKRTPEKKTPVLKIKKSRYMPEEERDSLGGEECLNISKKPYSDEYATSEDFQVQETVDSAKIKLTFKRHKGNFETEYKINSNDVEKVSAPELGLIREDFDKHSEMTKSKKKSKRAKKKKLFAGTDVESFKNNSEPSSDIERDSENTKILLESVPEEDSRNSSTFLDSCLEKENLDLKSKVPIFSELQLDYDKFLLSEERKKCDDLEDLKLNGETNNYNQEQVEFTEIRAINCNENSRGDSLANFNPSPDVNLKESTIVEALPVEKYEEEAKDFKKEEVQEISVDFIKSTKSPEIETNHLSRETEEIETVLNVGNNTEALKEKSSSLEISNEIKNSDNLEKSCELEFEKNSEKAFATKNLKIIEDLCDWKGDPLDNDDADRLSDNLSDNVKNKSKDSGEISNSFLSPLEVENENLRRKIASPEKSEALIKITKANEVLLPSEKTTEPCAVEECMNDFEENYGNNNSLQLEPDKSTLSDSELGGEHLKSSSEDFVKNDITCHISPLTEKNRIFSSSETSPNDICFSLAEFKNSIHISEKLNKNTNNCEKSPSPLHIKPEKTNRLNFELTLESAENIVKSDLECIQMTPEAVASVIVKTSNEICEDSSSELSPKSSFSKTLDTSLTKCHKIDYSSSLRKDTDSHAASFERAKVSSLKSNNSYGDACFEADTNGREKVSELDQYSFPFLGESMNSEIPLEGTNNLSVDIIQSDQLTNKGANRSHVDHSAKDIDLLPFKGIIKSKENLHFSPKTDDLEQLGEKLLENISGFTTASDNNQNVTINSVGQSFINDIKPDLSSQSYVELEDGEIIDSFDDLNESSLGRKQIVNTIQSFNKFTNLNKTQKKHVNFISRNIKRRHSTKPETLIKKKESQNLEGEIWFEREFSRAKSCPPELKYPEELLHETEETPNILTENIPLPVGPPPYSSCLNLKKYLSLRAQEKLVYSEAKEKPEKSIASEQALVNQKKIPLSNSPFGPSNFQNSMNPVRISPASEKGESAELGIFQRSSKIKFSFSKRSRFSKISFKSVKEPQLEVFSMSSQVFASESKVQKETEKKNLDFKSNKKIRTRDGLPADQNSSLNECQIKEVPNAIFARKTGETENCSGSEEIKKPQNELEQPVTLLCEDLDEKIEVIDALSNFITDEFYECEDIPTSEDLTNGDDLENEKVNDDKFRNIMQNCLDNAKKFLNVGNLKLFSCSVDDLLELDCQASESALGESEPEKPTNHISRDVLLTSCEDTIDDLGLSENVPSSDISMDFVPSFCSDVCSEILPVDNWPYLEEEVPSSPTKLKQDETDLIPSLENTSLKVASENCLQFCPKNGTERGVRKQIVTQNNLKSFRRSSLVSDEDGLRICSKIDAQRRKTIESFTGESCGRNVCDIKSELVKSNDETNEREKRSLKCRLSLEKLTNKHEINLELKNENVKHENKMERKSAKSLNYKSPSWQPRVMLFRISKNDLRKVVKSSNTQKISKSKNSGNSPKKEISDNRNDDVPAVKKQKFISECECEEKKVDGENINREKLVNLPRLDSIKGSLTAVTAVTDANVKRNRKSRFRNLHSKRKIASDMSKDKNSFAQNVQFAEPTMVHAETVLIKMFKDSNSSSDSLIKNTKEVICVKEDGEKFKRKLSEIKLSVAENHQNANSKSEEKLETSCSRGRSKEDLKEEKHCEKSKRSHSHKDKKREGKEQRKQKDRHKEGESKRHDRHSRSRHLWRSSNANGEPERCKREKYRSASGRDEKKWKNQKEVSFQSPWICEVCGFDDVNERVAHIKSHPFHCQSCHLAFKTETHFISHLTRKHKDIRNQHHCLLCELSFDTQEQYLKHLETREHRHLESVEKNTINTLFTLLTGAPCPVLGLVEMKPEWLPNQAGTVHFYHQATPLSLALQYLKMHHDLSSFSTTSSTHPI